jgi:hypothetical protein
MIPTRKIGKNGNYTLNMSQSLLNQVNDSHLEGYAQQMNEKIQVAIPSKSGQ